MPSANKTVRLAGVAIAWLLVMSLALVVYAQEPGDRKDEGRSRAIGSQELADPIPNGFYLFYTFSGARDNRFNTEEENSAATAVHCTNLSTDPIRVRVELSDFDNAPTIAGTLTITPGWTSTFSSQNTGLYSEDCIMFFPVDETKNDYGINQGSGRIMVDSVSADVICTAQIIDPQNNPPNYVAKLALHDGNGNLLNDGGLSLTEAAVHRPPAVSTSAVVEYDCDDRNPSSVFLPVILKQ